MTTRRVRWLAPAALAVAMMSACCPAETGQRFAPLDPAEVSHPADGDAPAASPRTYDDPNGFARRRQRLIRALAGVKLDRWRSGWFAKGGDPGKYLPLHVMARLLLDPNDPDALRYINDQRAPRQHFHFVAVNWARLLPQFGRALTPETRQTFTDLARRRTSYLSTTDRGTENHHVMQLTSGVVLADHLKTPVFGGRKIDQAKAVAQRWLRWYVRNLYHFGQGEWDSSTYVLFDINGMLNIYDFAEDPENRLLAKAALDWFAATYALKYVNGMHTGPKERGWTRGAFDSIGDQSAWLWWGSTATPTDDQLATFRYALHAASSSWRPAGVIGNIARRKLPRLPVELRSAKPNYWHGLDKPPIEPVRGVSLESLYITPHYTLGTLWRGENLCVQLLSCQIGAKTDDGAVSITASAPGSYNGKPLYTWGQGTHISRPSMDVDPETVACYIQYAQVGPTVIGMAQFPPDALGEKMTYITTPVDARPMGAWFVMQAGKTYIGVRPLTGRAMRRRLGKGKKALDALVFPGDKSGFVIHTADVTRFANRRAFAAHLNQRIGQDWRVDLAGDLSATVTALDGRRVAMTYNPDADAAKVHIDGEPVDYDHWPLYSGPYVRQKPGLLTVHDGQAGFTVDFTGDRPVYRPREE